MGTVITRYRVRTVPHNLFAALEIACTDRRGAERSNLCPAWTSVVGALLLAGSTCQQSSVRHGHVISGSGWDPQLAGSAVVEEYGGVLADPGRPSAYRYQGTAGVLAAIHEGKPDTDTLR